MENGGSAVQLLELDNKSPWYIELSASPALVPVCIGCSLSLQLSAWGGTVNDVFVLCSPFVLSWFLEPHKQAWNLFYPPQETNGRHPSVSVDNSALWFREGEFVLLFCCCALFSGRFYSRRKEGTFICNCGDLWAPGEFAYSSHELSDNLMHTFCQQLNMSLWISARRLDFRDRRDWMESHPTRADAGGTVRL